MCRVFLCAKMDYITNKGDAYMGNKPFTLVINDGRPQEAVIAAIEAIKEEMGYVLDDYSELLELDHGKEASATIKEILSMDIISQHGRYSGQWEDLGIEDWDLNHILGALIVYIDPKLLGPHSDKILYDESGRFTGAFEELADLIPDSVVKEMDLQAFSKEIYDISGLVHTGYPDFDKVFQHIKQEAIHQAAKLLATNT
ncbi:hypothetical protein D3C78_18960 [compost metagenome]